MEIIETKKDAKARSLLDFAPLRPSVLLNYQFTSPDMGSGESLMCQYHFPEHRKHKGVGK